MKIPDSNVTRNMTQNAKQDYEKILTPYDFYIYYLAIKIKNKYKFVK